MLDRGGYVFCSNHARLLFGRDPVTLIDAIGHDPVSFNWYSRRCSGWCPPAPDKGRVYLLKQIGEGVDLAMQPDNSLMHGSRHFLAHLRLLFNTVCVGILLLLFSVQPLAAHGGDRMLQLSDVAAGPFRLTVWTSPSILRTGEIHVETAVIAENGVPMKDSLVYVELTPLGWVGQTYQTYARAAVEPNAFIQEAAFKLDKPGAYQVTITAMDQADRIGRTQFEVEVIDISTPVKAGIYGLLLASLVAAVWICKQGLVIWFGGYRSNKQTRTNHL